MSAVDDEFDDEPTSTRLLPRHDEPAPDSDSFDDDDEPEREVIVWTRERHPRMQH